MEGSGKRCILRTKEVKRAGWVLTPGREVRGTGALRTKTGPLAVSQPGPWALGGGGAGQGGGERGAGLVPAQDRSTDHCTGESRGASLALQRMFLFRILGPCFLGCRPHPVYRTDQAKWAFLLLKNPTYSKDKHLKWKNMCEDWTEEQIGRCFLPKF